MGINLTTNSAMSYNVLYVMFARILSKKIQMVKLSIWNIHSGDKDIAPPMEAMGLLGVVAVKD